MTPPLFLLETIPDTDEILLSGDEGHHAARVKRVRPGESVLISNGQGTLARCTVRYVSGDDVTLAVVSRELVPEGQPRLVVVQALPKGDRAELAVETMTELGVDAIVPWAAARSVTQWHGARGAKALARWRRTAAEAAKQSRRARVPMVGDLVSSADVAAMLERAATAIVLHEAADEPLGAVPMPLVGDVGVVVGPEGGIAPDELERFTAAGAHVVRLGTTVLRTSTAGPAALAALSLRLGRWE
ncbi:RsmE family RNA methyltransferase [Jatrophihabitans fulvus]